MPHDIHVYIYIYIYIYIYMFCSFVRTGLFVAAFPRTLTLALAFGTGNDSCTCTAWGSSEAFVCLFVAVFLLSLWFNQFWGSQPH